MTARQVLEDARALIFDVDGTLYDEQQLWQAIKWRALRAEWRHPWRFARSRAIVRSYGRALEDLRCSAEYHADMRGKQINLAASYSGASPAEVDRQVKRWMEDEPLSVIANFMRAGLVDVLKTARSKEVRLGVLSDYPAQYKLERLCIEAFFDAVVDARDQAIGQLKPHPAGLTEVLRLLKVNPNEAVYIGDRVDVDVTAARRVGMRCLIIGSSEDPPEGSTWATVGNYLEVKHCL